MKLQPFQTLKHYNKKNLPKDILAGIIIMAVSIPISMGYAQIAGLPAVYGLYGSVFPDHSIRIVFHVTTVLFLVWMQLRLRWSDLPSSDLESKVAQKKPWRQFRC